MVTEKPQVTLDARLEASDDSSDEDYDPSSASKREAGVDEDDSGKEDELGAYDSGDEKTVKSGRVTHWPSDRAHEVKTRAQRAQEETQSLVGAAPRQSAVNVDDLWNAMNAPKAKTTTTTKKKAVEEEMIEIERTYVFAGEVKTERKIVPKHSQEGKDHLAVLAQRTTSDQNGDPRQTTDSKDKNLAPDADTTPVRTNASGKPLRKIYKRKSTLGDDKPRKLNTLEKSRMEWSGFVDRAGINEDLKRGNQAGYLDKMDFLRDSQEKMHYKFKQGQKK